MEITGSEFCLIRFLNSHLHGTHTFKRNWNVENPPLPKFYPTEQAKYLISAPRIPILF